jgi:hypothetical protein
VTHSTEFQLSYDNKSSQWFIEIKMVSSAFDVGKKLKLMITLHFYSFSHLYAHQKCIFYAHFHRTLNFINSRRCLRFKINFSHLFTAFASDDDVIEWIYCACRTGSWHTKLFIYITDTVRCCEYCFFVANKLINLRLELNYLNRAPTRINSFLIFDGHFQLHPWLVKLIESDESEFSDEHEVYFYKKK